MDKRQNVICSRKDIDRERRKKVLETNDSRIFLPIESHEDEKETIYTDLTALRNKVCLFFFLANAMFICAVFTLQQVASDTKNLSIPLLCIRVEYVGPISFVFMLVFGILLFMQFVCMIVHRFSNLIHICSRTSLFGSEDPKEENKTLYRDLCKESHDKPKSSKNQVSPLDRLRDTTNTIIEKQTLKKRLEALNDFAKKPGIQTENNREQMKAIKKQFPNLSATSGKAIYRLLLEPSVKVKMANVASREKERQHSHCLTVKFPLNLQTYVQGRVTFDYSQGHTPEQMMPIEIQ